MDAQVPQPLMLLRLVFLLCFFSALPRRCRLFSVEAGAPMLVSSLPGFDGALPFRLETGYVAVDEENGSELFYYLGGRPTARPGHPLAHGRRPLHRAQRFVFRDRSVEIRRRALRWDLATPKVPSLLLDEGRECPVHRFAGRRRVLLLQETQRLRRRRCVCFSAAQKVHHQVVL